MYRYIIGVLLTLLLATPVAAQNSYRIAEVAKGVYAAIAEPGGAATSNAMIVDLGTQVILCGAHFSRKAINDLIAAATEVSPNPIRAFVLAHHHPGYTFIDFDFPVRKDLVMTIGTRRIMKQEVRKLENPVIFFKEGLTFEGTERTLILTNVGPAHSNSDLIAYIPQSKVLFTSDLLYFNSVGFLGAGSLRAWAQVVDGLGALRADKIIPGFGPIGTQKDLNKFRIYLKDFLTEVLRHIENGDSLETTLRTFNLPQYKNLPGYESFTPGNIERAYQQLKD
ncbi:MAG: MBL fold metallo-hydrolase [Deltaproteobacteria bacterium]|nr:MBL fold metallo-hydrolase [Deltaproteobacteria bacterium]